MAVAKMKLVNIVGRLKDFDTVVRSCCIKGNFHPEQTTQALENYEEFMPIEEFDPYSQHLRAAVDIGVHSNLALGYRDFRKLGMSLEELASFVEKTGKEIGVLNENARELERSAARLEEGIRQLSRISDLEISLDDLFTSRFINYRFGRLPRESYYKLEAADDNDFSLFFPLAEDSEYYWGFYVTRKSDTERADEYFTALYFERINIIEEAHGTPKEAIADIRGLLSDTRAKLEEARKAVKDYWGKNEEKFLTVYSNLKYLNDSFELRRYAAKCGESFYIFGWVPLDDIPSFSKQFEKMKYVDCIIEDEEGAGNIIPPTSLKNSSVAKPFESFVEMYGLPAYNEIDPTPFMAMTYSVIFGIMFGDLGQGFLIFLVALWMRFKKKMPLGGILIRCSLFSMLFGTLYNSVFGYDNILPFTILPVHNDANVNYVLLAAIFFGIFLILGSMALNIINGIKQKSLEKIIFSHNGLSGMIFYIAMVFAVVMLMMYSKNVFTPLFVVLLVILPVLLIAFREPLARLCERRKDWVPQNMGDYLIQTFFEMFEILLSYLSNTISYIRIGAFVLSHSGMMIAVFAISELGGHGQNPIALVIGNAFVIALEGLIVGIQGLRLQFYEMFSRFYEGSGKPYNPVTIKYDS